MADYPAINGTKGVFNYTAYLPYYPTRFEVSDDLDTIRKVVWNFKDGRISKSVAETLAPAVKGGGLSNCTPLSDWWLCVIPASTQAKTVARFNTFCQEFCKLTGLKNGYSLLTNSGDRDAIHTQEDRNAVNIMDNIAFGDVAGKKIVLFDDIYTTGKSFLKVATKLKELGASEVHGLFLGKTHWLEETVDNDFDDDFDMEDLF